MKRWREYAVWVALVSAMLWVFFGNSLKPHPKPAPLTKEQAAVNACTSAAFEAYLTAVSALDDQELKGLLGGGNSISLSLQRRREQEDYCLRKDKCDKQEEPLRGLMFNSCLEETL